MGKNNAIKKSFSQLTKEGLEATRKKLVAEEKKKHGYLVIADKHGRVKKVPASQLR